MTWVAGVKRLLIDRTVAVIGSDEREPDADGAESRGSTPREERSPSPGDAEHGDSGPSIDRRTVLDATAAGLTTSITGCNELAPGTPTDGRSPTEPATTSPTVQTTTNRPDWEARTGGGSNLLGIVFESSIGTLVVRFTPDITAGDRATGTVDVAPTDGDSDLSGYELTVAGTTQPVTTDRVTVTVPEDAGSFDVTLRDPTGVAVAEATYEVHAEPPGYPTIPQSSTSPAEMEQYLDESDPAYRFEAVLTGSVAAIWGPFDGDAGTTSVRVGGEDAPIVAETFRQTVFRIPDAAVGRTTVELAQRGASDSAERRSVTLQTTPDAPTIDPDEQLTVDFTLGGLQGLAERDVPLGYLTLENLRPSVAEMPPGDRHTVVVHPGVVDDAGTFGASIPLTGNDGGAVAIAVDFTFTPPANRGDWLDAAFRGLVPSGEVTLGEWPDSTNVPTRSSAWADVVAGVPPAGRDSSRAYAVEATGVEQSLSVSGDGSDGQLQTEIYGATQDDRVGKAQQLARTLKSEIEKLAQDVEMTDEQRRKAMREAERIADCLVAEMLYWKNQRGWDGGLDENAKATLARMSQNVYGRISDAAGTIGMDVGNPAPSVDEVSGGICGQWATKMQDAFSKCSEGAANTFDYWNGTVNTWSFGPWTHQALLVYPKANGTTAKEQAIVIDPYRNNGNPYWIRADADPEYDWPSLEDATAETPNCEFMDAPSGCEPGTVVSIDWTVEWIESCGNTTIPQTTSNVVFPGAPSYTTRMKVEVRSPNDVSHVTVNGPGQSSPGEEKRLIEGRAFDCERSPGFELPCMNPRETVITVFFCEGTDCPPITVSPAMFRPANFAGGTAGGLLYEMEDLQGVRGRFQSG